MIKFITKELLQIKQIKNRAINLIIFLTLIARLSWSQKKTRKKNDIFDSVRCLYKAGELVNNAFKSRLFPLKSTTGTGLKVLTPKQMLERLSIALAQVKTSNNSESLLDEIRQIVLPLYQSKEITKKYTIT